MKRSIAAGVVAVALLCVGAAPASAGSKAQQRLALALDELIEVKGGPPGASVVLRRGNRERYLRAGVADLETGEPFRRNKYMRLASTSKAFSGAVALSLVDAGRLSLDDTIASRLPSLPAAWGPVTLRQALSHTGGLPSFTKDPGYLQFFSANLQDASVTIPQLIDFVADEPLDYPPGTAYAYSNTDNLVVALFAEAATGKTYDQLLAELVFDPLGLQRTALPNDSVVPAPRINGYDVNPTQDLTECCAMSFVSASGGLYSTPRELTRFVRGYAGGELFDGATRAAQFAFIPGAGSEPPGPGKNSGGLALFRYRTRCGTVFGHTGNFPGYTQFTASTRSGKRSLSFSVNRQLAPDAAGVDAPAAFKVLRRDYALAVCALLR